VGRPVAVTNPVEAVIRPVDRWQQRTGPAAFVFAVIKKFGDDRGGTLAALITFYGFVSLFPLLLVGFTVLSLVAGPGSHTYNDIRNSALHHFPVVGNQLPDKGLTKSGIGLVVGVVGLLWGSLGVAQAVQFAVNEVWGVPNKDRPAFLPRVVQSLTFIALLAIFIVVGQGLTGLGSIVGGSYLAGALGLAASLVVNVALFILIFKVLGPGELGWQDHLPGAVIAGVAWQVLQFAGQYLVQHDVRNMTPLYGQFAVVLGLISFLSLASQLILYSIEVNAVRKTRMWPRSILQPPLTAADERSLASRAIEEERRPEQHVEVSWTGAPSPTEERL
jgi:YihY family inner membrane protein